MKTKYTLVIIDMQEGFYVKSRMPVTSACALEIKKAIKNDARILFVEYEGFGPTLKKLKALTKGYPKTSVIKKENDDGSYELMCAINKRKYPKTVKITGINTSYCVHDTVSGLVAGAPLYKIEVIAKACADVEMHIIHRNVCWTSRLAICSTACTGS